MSRRAVSCEHFAICAHLCDAPAVVVSDDAGVETVPAEPTGPVRRRHPREPMILAARPCAGHGYSGTTAADVQLNLPPGCGAGSRLACLLLSGGKERQAPLDMPSGA